MRLHEMFVYVSKVQQIFYNGIPASKRKDFRTKTRTATLIRYDHTGEFIFAAGKEWAKFDYEAGFDALLALKGSSRWIADASKYWPHGFDYARAKAELERRGDQHWISQMPKGTQETIEAGEELKKNSEKMGKKPFGLKEDIDSERRSIIANRIFHDGLKKSQEAQFDVDDWLNQLSKYDKTGVFIFSAGKEWAKFNFKKGLDLLLKIGLPKYIAYAGNYWKEFDFDKARNELRRRRAEADNNDVRDTIDYWLTSAKMNWPKNARETVEAGEEMRQQAKKMPKKIFGLKEAMQFKSSIEGHGRTKVIFNPSVEEINRIAMTVRHPYRDYDIGVKIAHFIFDARKNQLYVFSPNEYHSRVMTEMGLSTLHQNTGDYPHGKLAKVDDQWRIESIKGVTRENYKKVENYIKNYLKENYILETLQDIPARDFWDRNLEHNDLRTKNETNAGATLALRIENAGDIIRELGKSWSDSGYINEKINKIKNSLSYSRDWSDPLSLKEMVYLNRIKKQIEEIPESGKLTPKIKELLRSIASRKVGAIGASLNDFREAYY